MSIWKLFLFRVPVPVKYIGWESLCSNVPTLYLSSMAEEHLKKGSHNLPWPCNPPKIKVKAQYCWTMVVCNKVFCCVDCSAACLAVLGQQEI